jgi:hypothetical protein
MSARGFSEEEEEVDLDAKIAEILAEGDSVDTEAYLQELLDAAQEEEDARVAAMTKEERADYEEQKKLDEEQKKLDEAQRQLEEELVEEYKPIMRRSDLASTTNRQRQSFARQAFDNRSNPRDDDEFGGGKKRTIRKKNRKGTRTTIRKRQRKNRTRTMRKKARKSRSSRKSNKAR